MTQSITKQNVYLKSALERLAKHIGDTPLVEFKHIQVKKDVRVLAKLEWRQLGGSVKARPAFEIIKQAIYAGELRPGRRLLDATSGNTGIAYGNIAKALGIPVTLCLPENASTARIKILTELGVELIFTSRLEGTDGAQDQAKALSEQQPDLYYYADQYNNEANWKAHYHGTAEEIWTQTNKAITHFIAGLGTTGTFTGTGRRLKELNEDIDLIALQPAHALHGLEGWKHLETAKIPGIHDSSVADRVERVETLEAYDMIKTIIQKEGLRLSPSSAANLVAAFRLADQLEEATIVTTLADDASKYDEVLKEIL